MVKRNVLILLFSFSVVLLGVSCSHARYQPEVGNANSVAAYGGVVYPIPANDAQLRMKLVSLPEPKKHTIHVRMYFKQVRPGQKATLDPMAQILILPDHQTEIRPSRVYASSKAKPLVDLSGREKQVVELVFSLPPGGEAYDHFQFRWKIAYAGGRTETQVTRFDREQQTIKEGVAQKQELEGDFPYLDTLGIFGPPWYGDDFGWWDGGAY